MRRQRVLAALLIAGAVVLAGNAHAQTRTCNLKKEIDTKLMEKGNEHARFLRDDAQEYQRKLKELAGSPNFYPKTKDGPVLQKRFEEGVALRARDYEAFLGDLVGAWNKECLACSMASRQKLLTEVDYPNAPPNLIRQISSQDYLRIRATLDCYNAFGKSNRECVRLKKQMEFILATQKEQYEKSGLRDQETVDGVKLAQLIKDTKCE